jgi:hypothetical protein
MLNPLLDTAVRIGIGFPFLHPFGFIHFLKCVATGRKQELTTCAAEALQAAQSDRFRVGGWTMCGAARKITKHENPRGKRG